MMPKTPINWPNGVLPRGLDFKQAAYYVGVSPTTFLKRVAAGRYPSPSVHGTRKVWDRVKLDGVFEIGGIANTNNPQWVDQTEVEKALHAIGGK